MHRQVTANSKVRPPAHRFLKAEHFARFLGSYNLKLFQIFSHGKYLKPLISSADQNIYSHKSILYFSETVTDAQSS